jgi:phosphohistidine swiveling domain-containing protein
MEKKLLSLGKIAKEDYPLVGPKAANLSALACAGFLVPEGFVIPITTYNKFLEKLGLNERINEAFNDADLDDEVVLERTSKRIKEMILSAQIEGYVREEFGNDFQQMGNHSFWAVRSSAVAEDLPDASFAGQQDTYLNIPSEEVPESVKRCWASYYNERAIAYRHNVGIPQTGGGIAVIVQRMVDARSSGIMFTNDPLDQDGRHILIESSWGLGESIASGLVSPDRFHCDWRNGKVLKREISHKTKAIFLSRRKEGVMDLEESRRDVPSVSDEELRQLCEVGMRMEELFEGPQDVEWAIEDEKTYFLQSRPITTLTKKGEELYTRAYGDEYWSDVTSPLFFSILGEYLTDIVNHEGARIMGYRELVDKDLLRLHKGHIYFNSAVLEAVFIYNPKFSRTKELLNYFPEKDQERIATARAKLGKRLWAEVRIAILDSDGMITRTDKAYRAWADGFIKNMRNGFDLLDLRTLSDAELESTFRSMEEAYLKHYRLIRYGMVTHSIGTNLMVKRWLSDWLDDKNGALYSKLVSGLEDNKTIKTNIALAKVAASVRADPLVLKSVQTAPSSQVLEAIQKKPEFAGLKRELELFMDEYGQRSHTRELFFPRWVDDPKLVIDIVRSLVEAPDLDFEKLEKDKIQERLETEKEVLEKIGHLRFGFAKKRLFKIVLNYAQIYLVFRENQRFYLDHMLMRQRKLFMEYGRRFTEKGWIDRPEDIFFLSKEEIFQIGKKGKADVRSKISTNRREFDRNRDRLPPKFLRGNVEFDDAVLQLGDSKKITGVSASPGIRKGRIRVVDSIEHLSEVKESEILVTANTDPGWTAVFSKIGGLVTETGGILSHGAVVSREYGIPAVTAVKGATKILKTGQQVTLDGNDGIIYLEEM